MGVLPGGYVKKGETLDQAAARTTGQRTGIENLFLKQFKTFGDPGRNRKVGFDEAKFIELTGIRKGEYNWLMAKLFQ